MSTKKVLILSLSLVLLLCLAAGVWMVCGREVDRSGWVEDNGIYYLGFDGNPVTAWQEIDGNTYYFLPDGRMATAWQVIDGQTYYFDTTGQMATLWQEIDGCRHYFGPDGVRLTGWQEIEGRTMFLDPQEGFLTGWQEIDGLRYFFDGSGAMLSGTVELEGVSYTFLEEGPLARGWHENRYYLDGIPATGWQEIDGQRYFFDEQGDFLTGWLEDGGHRYYLKEDGSAAVGPTEIDGETLFFNPDGIHIWMVNPWNFIPEDYTVELVVTEGGFRISSECYDALTDMLAGCRAAGLYPMLISGYRTYWDQVAMYNAKVAQYGQEQGSKIAALPNTSEHQLGLAVDIVAAGTLGQTLNTSTGETAVQKWLMEHCWDYGFILRYPEGSTDITGIIYEPWHYRYVGPEIARELKELGITLEEYLGAVHQD